MSLKNFNVKNGLTVGIANLDAASGNLVVGNANLGNLATANFFSGAGNALSNIQGGNVSGQVGNALVAGTVYTNSQPNITSVGTLTGLTVNGVSNLGSNSNVIITGGTNGQFLQTNGSGNLSWVTVGTSGISNGNSSVSVPVADGNIVANAGGNTTLVITSTGANITGYANISGNIDGGNLTTGGAVAATGNVSGGNITTGGVVSATGNVSGGNLTTGGAVAATGNVSGGNLTTGGVVSATGNVSGGNLTTAGAVAATGNISGGNINTAGKVVASTLESNVATGTAPLSVASTTLVANLNADLLDGYNTDAAATGNTVVVRDSNGNIAGNNISGTLSTASQPNITSVGTLSSLDVTGNVTTSANIVTDLIVGKTTSVTITAAGSNTNIFLKPEGTGVVDVWGKLISNVATPVSSTDAATKQYVDDVAQGLNIHDAAAAATPNTLASLSGGTVTYNNGTAGVGATLTTTGSYTTIDGVNVATVGTRILVKNEANAAHNGIYVYTSGTVLTRAADYNTVPEIEAGDFIFVSGGTLYDNTGWVQTSSVTTVGTDPIDFTQFSGAGTYTAGTGLTLSGSQFSISNTAVTAGTYGNGDAVASFQVNAQGQLVSASNVSIAANAANLTGSTLSSNITTSSLTSVGTLGNLSVTGNVSAGNVSATDVSGTTLGGTLTTAAQPNITSVGTLTSLSVTGNANAGNIGAASGVFTANVSAGNISTGGALSVTGNASAGNISTGGALSVTGNASAGNISTGGTVAATGNVSGGNISTGGALSVTGNANVGNLGTGGLIVATGNISGGNINTAGKVVASTFESNVADGTAPFVVVSTTKVANLNADLLDGFTTATANTANTIALRNADGNLSANYFIGNGAFLTGIDTSLIANGNSNVSVAQNGNVTINVSGNAGIATFTGTGANIGGYANVTGNLTAGNVSATDVSGTTLGGTLTTASQPNITSVGTLTSLAVTNNGTFGNVYANSGTIGANLLTGTLTTNAQPNITSVGTLSSLAVTGNITAGNVTGANLVSANYVAGTLTTAAQPNITSVGQLTSLDVVGNIDATYTRTIGYSTDRANVAVTTNTVIDQFNPSTFRTAKYVISASGDDGYQSVETLLVHDGVDAYITIYGSVCSNVSADIIDISANINGVSGNVAVYATTSSDNVLVNVVASYIKT